MNTRIIRYCNRIMEAGWLVAVILTPVFFDIYSSRVFEPDKLTVLRSIAVLMVAAWLVRALATALEEDGDGLVSAGGFWRTLRSTPLLLQVVLLLLVYLLATALSVVPRISFWGSYQRLQGLYSTLSYLAIFFIAWQNLRTRAQLERLLNTIVLASLPVGFYGVLQHYGMDPLPWSGSVVDRVTGNLGNAIFISAYLIMAFFITLERLVACLRRILVGNNSRTDAFVGASYLFVLVLQSLSIYFSKSRGPWLGLLVGVYIFVLVALVAMRRAAPERGPLSLREAGNALIFALLSPLTGLVPAYAGFILARRGRRWLWLSWCIQSLLAAAFLLVFNLPQTPLAALHKVPGVGRLGQIFETDEGTGRVRVLIWQGASEMFLSNPLRALVGYGPETMYVAYNHFYPPELGQLEQRNASPDRSHNETFDALLNTGLIGFLVYVSLLIGIFLYGLRWLGFIPENGDHWKHAPPWQHRLFLALASGGATLGVVLPLALDRSLRFAGVGLPAGLIAGLVLFLAISALASSQSEEAAIPFGEREVLLAGLLAMIAAHFVEISFGIAIAATRLYFWLGLALLISLGSGRLSLQAVPARNAPAPRPIAAAPASGSRKHKRRRQEVQAAAGPVEQPAGVGGAIAAGLLGALLLGTLLFDFTANSANDTNPVRILWQTLVFIRPPGQAPLFSPGMIGMIFLTWIIGAIVVIGEARNAGRPLSEGWWPRALGAYLGISLSGALVFALIHAAYLQDQQDMGWIIYRYLAFGLGIVLLAACFIPQPEAGPVRESKGRPLLAGAGALLVTLAAGILILLNGQVVRADIYYKQGWEGLHQVATNGVMTGTMDQQTAQRYYDAALHYYDLAMRQAPDEDYYLLFAGKAFLERAQFTGDANIQAQYLAKAEETIQRARKLNPLNTDHTANLARISHTWALLSTDSATRQAKLEAAVRYYAAATQLSPNSAALFVEWGRALMDLGRPKEALVAYQKALALDDRYIETYLRLGEYYTTQEDLQQASVYYQRAVALEPRSDRAHSALAYIYAKLGKPAEAISESLQVLEVYPQDYTTLKNLAILYRDSGQIKPALDAAQAALQVAPAQDRPALEETIRQLQAALGQGGKP